MLANYGYVDGTGDYFITIDTDACDGCDKCMPVCPEGIFHVAPDDYAKRVAAVKQALVDRISYVCPGPKGCRASQGAICQDACPQGAISHSW